MPEETPISRDLARRLMDRELVRRDAPDSAAAAAHAASERVFQDLSRWVGHLGSAALFRRALLSAQREHAGLKDVRIRTDTAPPTDEVGDVLQTGGSNIPPAALEAVLVELIELLNRFIGADMVVRILYLNSYEPRKTTSDRTSGRPSS